MGGPFSSDKKKEEKIHPKIHRKNSNRNLGVSRRKSTLQGSGFDHLVFLAQDTLSSPPTPHPPNQLSKTRVTLRTPSFWCNLSVYFSPELPFARPILGSSRTASIRHLSSDKPSATGLWLTLQMQMGPTLEICRYYRRPKKISFRRRYSCSQPLAC